MSFESTRDWIVGLVREHMALAEPAVFVIGFAEGVPGLSMLVPSAPLFLGIGAAHAAAGGRFWHLVLAASIGAVCSDVLVYAVARHFEADVVHSRLAERHPTWWPRAHRFFERWGVVAVLIGKFAGPMRPFVPALAGLAEMPLWQFLPSSIVSTIVWSGAFLAPGYGLRFFID